MIYDLPNPFMDVSLGTLLRQPKVIDSRDVAAEWGSFPLDADGDTKRLSTLEADGQIGGSGAPNFMQVSAVGIPTSDREAAALEPDEPPFRGGVAAEPAGFVLDEEAFAAELDPVPAFLTRDNDYGTGEQTARQSAEWGRCLNHPPLYAGRPGAGPTTIADEIEELLKLARAEEWPAPPVLRRANG